MTFIYKVKIRVSAEQKHLEETIGLHYQQNEIKRQKCYKRNA